MDQNGRPRQAAPGIRSTVSYIIFLESILGQGATSKVYLGRHKKSGKRVACKVPHMPSLFRLGIDMDRESQVLLRLRHPNIVCLEAIEKDQISRENILLMELCTGGSLYDMLEKPEHSYGVQEKVFLKVLNDMTCGMKYLRDNGLIHRDVKPGNIMCYRDQNGKTIYKLADFGAARELTDDENFTSLHGTEEYLHPNIFERAVLRRPVAAPFDARVDLWSIGATLYHIATGSLPFRPLGGRKNSSMMFYLTTKKASGVISGVQVGPTESEVIWSTGLPETCQLSEGLRRLVTPLLAGLLEYNPTKVWSFNQFFEVSQAITNKMPLDVFWVCQSSVLRVYSNPTDTFAEFQELIAAQTKLPASKQMFILDGETFRPNGTLAVCDYPTVSKSNPIMLCNKEQICIPCQIFPPLVGIMPILHPRFSTQNDYPIAKSAVTVGHVLQRRQTDVHHMHQFFDYFVKIFGNGLSSDVLKLQAHSNNLKGTIVTVSKEIDTARRILANWLRVYTLDGQRTPQPMDGISNTVHQLASKLDIHYNALYQCEQQFVDASGLLERLSNDLNRADGVVMSWKPSQGCNLDDNACATELVHHTGQMEEIFKRFSRDKKAGKLSYNDEQIHKMEKLSLGEIMKQTMKCISRCEDRWRDRHNKLMIWYNKAHNHRVQISKADSLLTPLIKKCEGLKENISDLSSKIWQVIESRLNASGKLVTHPSAKENAILLSTSTQTSLPTPDLHQPLTNGLDHHTQLTKGGQPVVMGLGQSPVQTRPYIQSATSPTSPPMRYAWPNYPKAVSVPSCGPSHMTNGNPFSPVNAFYRSSPPVLVAHGMSSRVPDSPSELKGQEDGYGHTMGAMASAGDGQQGTAPSGSRMIKVSKRMKQDIENYKKQSLNIPQILKESSEVMSELADLSLGDLQDLQTPPFNEDSSFLATLTAGATGGCDEEDDIGSLDIKRPPNSYRSFSE